MAAPHVHTFSAATRRPTPCDEISLYMIPTKLLFEDYSHCLCRFSIVPLPGKVTSAGFKRSSERDLSVNLQSITGRISPIALQYNGWLHYKKLFLDSVHIYSSVAYTEQCCMKGTYCFARTNKSLQFAIHQSVTDS